MAKAERRAAEERRHVENEQRHAQEDLMRKFARYTTPELQAMRRRYAELVSHPGTRDQEKAPLGTALFGTSDRQNTERLIEVERELLRRYAAGDKEAAL